MACSGCLSESPGFPSRIYLSHRAIREKLYAEIITRSQKIFALSKSSQSNKHFSPVLESMVVIPHQRSNMGNILLEPSPVTEHSDGSTHPCKHKWCIKWETCRDKAKHPLGRRCFYSTTILDFNLQLSFPARYLSVFTDTRLPYQFLRNMISHI